MDLPSNKFCINCNDASPGLRDGWISYAGQFVKLCERCYPFYESKQFCETFHNHMDGWRDCSICGKLVHCGCIVSFPDVLMVAWGVLCKECSRIDALLVHNREKAEQPMFVLNRAKQIKIAPRHWPRDTGLENSQSVVVLLFEIVITANNSDFKLGVIVIPRKCAEVFFPKLSDLEGAKLNILDTEGKTWDVRMRYWVNQCAVVGAKMYYIQGLKDFMISKNLQVGDTVVFYRMEPDGKTVLGVGKNSLENPPHQVST